MFAGYLKLQGIKGESKAIGRKDWIDIEGFNCALTRDISRFKSDGTIVAAIPNFSSFEFQQRYNRGSVEMFMHCLRGEPIGVAEFDVCRMDVSEKVKVHIEFENCLITSIQVASQAEHVVELVEVTFGSVRWLPVGAADN